MKICLVRVSMLPTPFRPGTHIHLWKSTPLPRAALKRQWPSKPWLPTGWSRFTYETKPGTGQLLTVPSAYVQRANVGVEGAFPKVDTPEGIQSTMLLLEDNFCTLDWPMLSLITPAHQIRIRGPLYHTSNKKQDWAKHLQRTRLRKITARQHDRNFCPALSTSL